MPTKVPYEENVSSKYGAPMGRRSDPIESLEGPVYLCRVPFVDGDYDKGGAYWGGGGQPLFCAWDENGSAVYFRAPNRAAAASKLPGVNLSPAPVNVEGFIDAYVECALWSSNDRSDESGGEPLDSNYGPEDIAPEALAKMRADCEAFIAAAGGLLVGLDDSQSGHDFWLTRNGHGTGFWDRGLGALGDQLTKACKAFREVDLSVGDDGLIYLD